MKRSGKSKVSLRSPVSKSGLAGSELEMGHSGNISGAGNVGLRWAEMESWDMDREKEDTEGGWAARGKHVSVLRVVIGYNPSF